MSLLNLVLGLVLSVAVTGYEHAYSIEVIKGEPVSSDQNWSEVGEDTFSVDGEDDFDKSYYYQPIIYGHGYNYDKTPVYGWDGNKEGYDSNTSPIYDWDSQQKPDCQYSSGGVEQQPTIDTQQRQDSQQTLPNLPPGSSNENLLKISPKPLYRPTLQNSTSLRMCKKYHGSARLRQQVLVVNGENAVPKEFPHIALLGYGDASNIQWSCGGTLISDQFVLTAAHCLRHKIGPVQYVRLGELDLSTTTEESDVKDFTVSEVFKHPNYRSFINYYDIALLRLNASVSFNDYIKPACLATRTNLDIVLTAAGWGKLDDGGDDATILQRVYLSHVPNDRCRNIYGARKNYRSGIVEAIQICAVGIQKRGDTCQGDSGGPLETKTSDYSPEIYIFPEVIGVTSFGGRCGAGPGVYTRVMPFIDWIESIVWPNN